MKHPWFWTFVAFFVIGASAASSVVVVAFHTLGTVGGAATSSVPELYSGFTDGDKAADAARQKLYGSSNAGSGPFGGLVK